MWKLGTMPGKAGALPRPTLASNICFGLLFALHRMGSHIPPGRSWDDVDAAVEYLTTLRLLEKGLPGDRPTARAELCGLLLPHLSDGFVDEPSPHDILLLFAVVVLSAEAYGEEPESWAAAASLAGWLPAVVQKAVERTKDVGLESLVGRLDS